MGIVKKHKRVGKNKVTVVKQYYKDKVTSVSKGAKKFMVKSLAESEYSRRSKSIPKSTTKKSFISNTTKNILQQKRDSSQRKAINYSYTGLKTKGKVRR